MIRIVQLWKSDEEARQLSIRALLQFVLYVEPCWCWMKFYSLYTLGDLLVSLIFHNVYQFSHVYILHLPPNFLLHDIGTPFWLYSSHLISRLHFVRHFFCYWHHFQNYYDFIVFIVQIRIVAHIIMFISIITIPNTMKVTTIVFAQYQFWNEPPLLLRSKITFSIVIVIKMNLRRSCKTWSWWYHFRYKLLLLGPVQILLT